LNHACLLLLTGMSCALLLPPSMLPQSDSAAITGTVSDSEGNAVVQAAIQVTDLKTGMSYKTSSAATGDYTFAQLPPGAYEISAFVPGLLPFKRPDIALGAAATLRIDIRLREIQLGTLGENREVIASLMIPRAAPSGPVPRTSDGKPDLSGVWAPSFPVDPGKPAPLPWAEAVWRERMANNLKDAPAARCLPTTISQMGMFAFVKLVQTPTLLVMMAEGELPRQVFLDGRGHPKDPDPTWMGHSIGRWEGDTLVVDTVGFNDKNWLFQSYPQTERLHFIERFRRSDFGHLETEITIDDPGAFAKPWIIKKVSALAPDTEITETVCVENNRDVEHLVGK